MSAWKTFVCVIAAAFTVSMPVRADRHTPLLPAAKMADNGMHAQTWLYRSSLDLRQDLTATAKQGKRLVIFWEQRDCAYCKPMYDVNLRIPRIVEKVTKNFNVIKLDIQGERAVTDLDGAILTEGQLARKFRIMYTPTLQFLPESMEKAAGRNIADSEVFRAETYFKPFHFNFIFHYVQTKGYESEPNFQRWLGDIGRGLDANGIEYDLWADALPPHLPDKY